MNKSLINIQIATQWLAAFNEHKLDALLALYHNNAIHFSPKLKIRNPESEGKVEGKAALHHWWLDAFERLPKLHYEATTLTANDDRIFMEYIRQVPNEPDMNIAEVLEIDNNLIMASRVYHG